MSLHAYGLPILCVRDDICYVSPDRAILKRNGFTLIELLVVIAIISLVCALILPAISRAKERGQSIGCLSNVRQVALSFKMHLSDTADSMNDSGRAEYFAYHMEFESE